MFTGCQGALDNNDTCRPYVPNSIFARRASHTIGKSTASKASVGSRTSSCILNDAIPGRVAASLPPLSLRVAGDPFWLSCADDGAATAMALAASHLGIPTATKSGVGPHRAAVVPCCCGERLNTVIPVWASTRSH